MIQIGEMKNIESQRQNMLSRFTGMWGDEETVLCLII